MKCKSALRPCGWHVLSCKMGSMSCLFLCLFTSQSLIPRTSASAAVCPLDLKCSATGKPGAFLLILRRCSPITFPQSVPSLADVNDREATAGDAVNRTGGQASEGIFDGEAILCPHKIGFAGNMTTSTATWVLTWTSTYACCSLLFCRVN